MPAQSTVATGPKRQTKIWVGVLVVIVSVVVGFLFLRSQAATVKPGDLNGDGKVTNADLALISQNMNKKNITESEGDMDGDGDVDITDLSSATSKLEQ